MPEETDELTSDIQFFEYTKAANPLAKGTIQPVAFGELSHTLHESGITRVIPFDLSAQLDVSSPATSPNLSANFLRILGGEKLETRVNATSELYYVLRGEGVTERDGQFIQWSAGDFFVVPGGKQCSHKASKESALYWVNDQPLLEYLGVAVKSEKFKPTLYKAEQCQKELDKVASDPHSKDHNRVSVLLANKNFGQTMTITHVLWAMFGILPAHSIQLPHRHNSVALDLILDCPAGCYTLVAKEIDDNGNLIEPIRQDWKPYSAFVTPPFYWHAHYNETDTPAHLIPIQDAGLQTYMRTLDIEFAHAPKHEGKPSPKLAAEPSAVSGIG
jgi:gentisate 1,2-dioxygenase